MNKSNTFSSSFGKSFIAFRNSFSQIDSDISNISELKPKHSSTANNIKQMDINSFELDDKKKTQSELISDEEMSDNDEHSTNSKIKTGKTLNVVKKV